MKTTSNNNKISIGKQIGTNLLKEIKNAKESVKIVSPYLSAMYIEELVNLSKKGVKITLIEIFDAGDFGTANLDFELAYNCGDLKCDEFETSENCCKDCGCSGALKCVENSCILPECTLDSQCEDSNSLTEDYCSEFKCKHRNIKCEKNLDCNDNNLDTDDTCYKGNCRNFLNYVCKTNEDCEDQNPCTTDLCVNKDCQNTLKENCEFESEPEKTILEKQNEEIKNNLEEDVKKLRENVLTKVLSWFKNLFN